MTSRRPAGSQSGFTLLEGLIVGVVAAIVLATAVPSFVETVRARRLEGRAAEVSADLQMARSHAVSTGANVKLQSRKDTGGACYVLYTGPGQCTCDVDGSTSCDADTTLVRVNTFPAGDAVRWSDTVSTTHPPTFGHLTGTVTPGATVCLSTPAGSEIRHTVNMQGRVRTCRLPSVGTSCAACPA